MADANSADAKNLARQWLETDAAFGVTEVPLPMLAGVSPGAVEAAARPPTPPRSPGPAAPAAPMPPVAAAPAARHVAPASRPTPATAPIPTAPPATTGSLLPGIPGTAKSTAAKRAPALPAAPTSLIADLPPMTRAQKEAAFSKLAEEINAFAAPLLNDIATRAVFGEGDCDADLMFVGEGPGAEEDRTGRPFVGRSGQLLDKMIAAIGYQRAQVFIGNIVKLRAADWTEDGSRLQDRPPNPEEVARWIPFLHRQIEIIRPRVIVTLGAPAVKWLTGTTEGVMKIRGTWLAYRGIPVMPTYHPAFVLRAYTEENRRKVWNDLKAAAAKARDK